MLLYRDLPWGTDEPDTEHVPSFWMYTGNDFNLMWHESIDDLLFCYLFGSNLQLVPTLPRLRSSG
jgi:hypothetical protein